MVEDKLGTLQLSLLCKVLPQQLFFICSSPHTTLLFTSMERTVATLMRPLLGVGLALLLLLRLPGTHASGPGRRLSHPDPLPPCSQVPDGVAGWDCDDEPISPLRPCDFHHQRVGVDCSGWRPVAGSHAGAGAGDAASPTKRAFESKTRPLLERHIAIDLPPCSHQGSGGGGGITPDSWQCYDAPTSTRPGPPATAGSNPSVTEATPATATTPQESLGTGTVKAELPPCSQVPMGIPGWDCYDPPNHPLPPCDFKHQRIGFDCSGWPPRRMLLAHEREQLT